MLFGYQYVDPLEGEFPTVTAGEAGAIVRRMRRILAERSRADLDRLISQVNQFLRLATFDRHGQSRALAILAREAEAIDAEIADFDTEIAWDTENEDHELQDALRVDSGEVRQLLWAMKKHELEGEQWSHLFAAFGLSLLNEAAEAEQYYSSWRDVDSPFHEWRVLYNVTTWTKIALEAAVFAEALEWGMPESRRPYDANRVEDESFRKRLSARARAAAYERHAATDRAILALFEFHSRREFPSLRAAALAYCEEHPDAVKHLAPTNRLRTLAEGLGRQVRGKRRNG